jgi:hypothetical protein
MYSAQDYLDFDGIQRASYVGGLVDGWLAAHLYAGTLDGERVERFLECTQDMKLGQMTEIVTKYIKDHPETWHLHASVQAYAAFVKACPAIGGGQ